MPDTTIKKVEAGSSPRGEMGQKYLVAGKRVSMRLWIDEPGGKLKGPTSRDYETVGYVISGSAKLDLEGQTLNLKAGDSWLVPAGATHQYTIIEPFTAVEATAPPAEVHGRDEAYHLSGSEPLGIMHFGNVNYRHMPLTRLIFSIGSLVLSGCRNQLTVPADGNPACVHRGRVSCDPGG